MISNPLVSIIISAFNAEKYINETLDSVLKQTWPNLEIIVVNDGSTDNTLSLAESYTQRGVMVISQENQGQDAALNKGLAHAKGEYIKFVDSDDLISFNMIELQMSCLNNSNEHVAYGEWARFYNGKYQDADFTPLSYWKNMTPLDFLTAEPNGVMLQCGSMLIPRKLIEMAGVWDERLVLFNDTEFFTRILLKSKGVIFTPGARLYYRSGLPGSISAGQARRYYESTFLATNLIAQHLLAVEDSPRIRKLISNTYLMQYYNMYPMYADLARQHEEKVTEIGYGTYKAEGGYVFNILSAALGWKNARRLQNFFYRIGYLKLINKDPVLKHKTQHVV